MRRVVLTNDDIEIVSYTNKRRVVMSIGEVSDGDTVNFFIKLHSRAQLVKCEHPEVADWEVLLEVKK